MSKFLTVGGQKHAGKHWEPVCELYATSHKRPFVPSVGGIDLLCNLKVEGQVSFAKVSNWVTDSFKWLCELL